MSTELNTYTSETFPDVFRWQALTLMRRQGFEHAQASVSRHDRHEVCVAHNEASLMRSAQSHQVQDVGAGDFHVHGALRSRRRRKHF